MTPSQNREPDATPQRPADRRQPTVMAIVAAAVLASIMIAAGAVWWLRSPDSSPSATVVSATADKQAPPAALISAVAPSAVLAKLAAASALPRMSIVVLAFTNLSGDPALEYFADGFTENLTTDLSRISGSFVIARTTANTYKGKAVSEKAIASELGVRYVLEGGVQKAGNHVRVNAQLIDGETGAHLWAERYDRDSADFLQVQDEITNQIANALNLTLTQSESDKSWRDHPSNPDAVDLTLRANALLGNGPISPEINAHARRLYEQAVELDPKNVDALISLAETYTNERFEAWNSSVHPSEMQDRINNLLTRALAIDPRSAHAYHVKSVALTYDHRRDWRGEIIPAIDAEETALALNPNRPISLVVLGRLYSKIGHPERTGALVEQAMRLSPRDPALSTWLYALGMSQLQTGDNDEAIKTFRKSLVLAPRKVISWAGLTGALFAAGRDDEAHDALVKWREVAVSEGGYDLNGPPAREILEVRVELALLRLGRWPNTLDPYPHEDLWKALFKFQADENLPQTGQPDEATLARLGITSQASASASK